MYQMVVDIVTTSDVRIRIQGFFSWIRIQTSKRWIRIQIQEKMGEFRFESGFRPLLVGHNSIKNLLLWPNYLTNDRSWQWASEHVFSWDVLSWLPKVLKHACHVPLLINSLYWHLGPSVISWIRIRTGFGFGFKKIEMDSDSSGFGFEVSAFGSGFGSEISGFPNHW